MVMPSSKETDSALQGNLSFLGSMFRTYPGQQGCRLTPIECCTSATPIRVATFFSHSFVHLAQQSPENHGCEGSSSLVVSIGACLEGEGAPIIPRGSWHFPTNFRDRAFPFTPSLRRFLGDPRIHRKFRGFSSEIRDFPGTSEVSSDFRACSLSLLQSVQASPAPALRTFLGTSELSS